MSIVRTVKSDNYSTICNKCLRDPDLTARAKGMFAYIMTLPDDWRIYKSELHKHFKEGRDALNTAFSELESAGYVSKAPHREGDGTVSGWDYTIYESTELLETRNTVNPSDGESVTTKYLSQLNTNSTKGADAPALESDSELSNPKPSPPNPKKAWVPPTEAEVKSWAGEWALDKGKNAQAVCIVAEEARQYYERMDWKNARGKKVNIWKTTITGIWFTDEKIVRAQGGQFTPTQVITKAIMPDLV